MSTLPALTPADFPDFLRSLHAVSEPFPWQQRLLHDLIEGKWRDEDTNAQNWPSALALPTASGKTACIDIALFHLALEAELPPQNRTAPRRIFFCVDRRVIVDEAYERALLIAKALRRAVDEKGSGVLSRVAKRVRSLSGDDFAAPVAAIQLRGGMYRDDAWAVSPLQPTVICTTVDQLGSRLLFRGYGVSPRSAPIHAGLAGNDALIFLDEAHCAEPFRQTLEAVRLFRGGTFAEEPLNTPFAFVEMSATPRSGAARFELAEEDLSPDHLGPRLMTPKAAQLTPVPKKGSIEEQLAICAQTFADQGARRIAIMVNRVDTAKAVFELLKATDADPGASDEPVKALMIGRMRPLDRDDLLFKWQPYLKADTKRCSRAKPAFVVATQCLEVGANFDFDALVTECASLDALRQRFGRLNRLGKAGQTYAAIVASPEAQKDSTDDPIYGAALHDTWKWLCDHAQRINGQLHIDFCATNINDLLPNDEEERAELLRFLSPPARDAPVMLPAHLDLWCQTAPLPDPDPDVAPFLHGPQRGVPTVSVCWRADLPDEHAQWAQTLAPLPPSSPECMPVPLHLLRKWMRNESAGSKDDTGDLEHAAAAAEDDDKAGAKIERSHHVLVWRGGEFQRERARRAADAAGRRQTQVTNDPDQVIPGDVVVIPAAQAPTCAFGHLPAATGSAAARRAALDRAEQANLVARRRGVLRLQPDLLHEWYGDEASALIDLVRAWNHDDPGEQLDDLKGLLKTLAARQTNDCPTATADIARSFIAGGLAELPLSRLRASISPHPAGGLILALPGRLRFADRTEHGGDVDFSDEADDSSVAPNHVTLAAHTTRVAKLAVRFARGVGLEHVRGAVSLAARLHDLGKLDPRFQAVLRGSRLAALASEPLAKSVARAARNGIPRDGLPDDFRHEMLSMQIAEHHPHVLQGIVDDLADLALHLIASHHGHARALAPVVHDDELPPLPQFAHEGLDDSHGPLLVPPVSASERTAWVAPHRLDSGICDRFWTLTRRHGWWGLAYLEAVLRLADRTVSRWEEEGQ
ncbi:MAG: type I-U CRISPR-associated helicase/endonuclease Cas3 [Phycisphaerae bacterium]|nr:type I-U CRISPR-associated helicase/endonuclease Cas3 [Phycisphaerae bacterium]